MHNKGEIMKRILIAAALACCSVTVLADNLHRGYVRKDGAYVQPHYQSAPDNSRANNYSSQGNTNPYTGQQGHVDPYKQPTQQQYNYQNNGQPQRQKSPW